MDGWKPCLWVISISHTLEVFNILQFHAIYVCFVGVLHPQGPPCEEELVGEEHSWG